MDILFISKYLVVIALIILMLAALRASAYKSTSMGLLGSSVIVNAFALALLIIGGLYNLEFYKDNDIHETVSVITDWGHIREVESIALCTDEVVVLPKWSDMKVNILYKRMDVFEVRVIELE